jgi:hypothetical protein
MLYLITIVERYCFHTAVHQSTCSVWPLVLATVQFFNVIISKSFQTVTWKNIYWKADDYPLSVYIRSLHGVYIFGCQSFPQLFHTYLENWRMLETVWCCTTK